MPVDLSWSSEEGMIVALKCDYSVLLLLVWEFTVVNMSFGRAKCQREE